jgi:heptosyltransferase-1
VRILVVKTSSMGDIVHALPAVSDIASNCPGTAIDWIVEPPFAAIPALHPAVRQVLPMAWRKWRKRLWSGQTWTAMAAFRRELRAQPYDLVLDLQGLVKSALWAAQARGPRAGYDRHSIWEPVASLLYQRVAAVPKNLHAIERCRRLAAAHLGYALPAGPPRFGLVAPPSDAAPAGAFAVLIPGASRPEKLWPEADWIALARRLRSSGMAVIVFWGSKDERERAARIAIAADGQLPAFLSVRDAAGVLGRARLVVGLDTGFTHLAAALGVATIGIYCDHEPAAAGVTGDGFTASLGGIGKVPPLAAVDEAVDRALASLGGEHARPDPAAR